MIYALIKDNKVDNIIIADETVIESLSSNHDAHVLLDELESQPSMGWDFDGTNFSDPNAVSEEQRLQDSREALLASLRDTRKPLLSEADIEINKLEDTNQDSASWRAYRQALRESLDAYRDANNVALDSLDSVNVNEFEWPTKP